MKKMKCDKKFLLGILVGFSFAVTFVFAAGILAKDISFSPNQELINKGVDASSVEDALNELYSKALKPVEASNVIGNFTISASLDVNKINITAGDDLNNCIDDIDYFLVKQGDNILYLGKDFSKTVYSKAGQNHIVVLGMKGDLTMYSSNGVLVDVPDLIYIPLEYPLFYDTGIYNVKAYKGSTFYSYTYNPDYDCTASDALPKAAYDGDLSTYVDTTKTYKVILKGGLPTWNFTFKVSGSLWLDVPGGYARGSEVSITSDGYSYASVWGKKVLFENDYTASFRSNTGYLYELKYDTNH